ncbi:MAG TPA: phage holin family protein [Candidatus Caenarcaniphilales bacterium]|nr:phage holin family protein [Candidatus Caenarcaniphilales bacterium]
MTATRDDRSLGELFAELSQQTSTLVKKEIELARHEVTRSVTSLGRDAAMIGAGGAIAYAGGIVLLIGIAWLLTFIGLPVWLSFVLVGGITVAIGAFLAMRAMQAMKKTKLVPERTVETVKEDVEWAKDQTQ